ncbi:MAG: tetratricopeptide repeat protein [Rhodospirillales bacterium]|jgi:tetratricopeptide (TPR) repeat protein|nr:tetratricopeptide repeat protein [Rhodospirillales bacterium]
MRDDWKDRTNRSVCIAVVGVVLAAGTALAAKEDWSWTLPVAQYRELDIRQRAVVDRASDLDRRAETSRKERREAEAATSFRAAAQEWKRFMFEFMDAPEVFVAYAHFMQAYSLHQAGDRNAAVKLYSEVADFYPDAPSMLVAALYWRGIAKEENGDGGQAVADWELASGVPGTEGHPLAVQALERLASVAWDGGKWASAAGTWETVLDRHPDAPRQTREIAARRLALWRGLQGQWTETTRIVDRMGAETDNPTGWMDGFVWNAWHDDIPNWLGDGYFKRSGAGAPDAAIGKLRRELVEWYAGRRAVHADADKEWNHDLAVFNYRRMLDSDKAQAEARKLVAAMKAAKLDAESREKYARRFIDILVDSRLPEEARSLLGMIVDSIERLRVAYRIEEQTRDYVAAEAVLGELELQGSPQVVREAKRLRAYLYKDRMGKFEKAIGYFNEAVDPPESLWGVQECLWRLGRKDEAQAMLGEIVGAFPKDAPRAMFQKAEYFRLDGEKASAIACYRRILSNPEWGRSGEASRAHQSLEGLGVETGGGVLNAVN